MPVSGVQVSPTASHRLVGVSSLSDRERGSLGSRAGPLPPNYQRKAQQMEMEMNLDNFHFHIMDRENGPLAPDYPRKTQQMQSL